MSTVADNAQKVAAWEAFHKNALEELETMTKAANAEVDKAGKARQRLKGAPVVKELTISYTPAGANQEAQSRTWEKPTLQEMTTAIPKIIMRALREITLGYKSRFERSPAASTVRRQWKPKLERAQSKVGYAMVMATNARANRAVPMPALEPVPHLPIEPITTNTSADPNFVRE